VLDGLFALSERLLGVRIERAAPPVDNGAAAAAATTTTTMPDTWHPDVSFYRVYDEVGELHQLNTSRDQRARPIRVFFVRK
jgi:Zn-dependent oligopeptidase